jgi:NAD(P)-dependent dehydrogenase (short-subunit alcohol dehydrogenase family)
MQNLFDVRGKVVLVTGGSRGIGEMIAEGFVGGRRQGLRLVAEEPTSATRSPPRSSKKGTCIALPGDCGTEQGCRASPTALAAREYALHVLVNNAGANWGAPFERTRTRPSTRSSR